MIVLGRKGSYGKVNWSANAVFASDTTFFADPNTTKQSLRWLYWVLQTLKLDEGSGETAIPGLNRETAYEKQVFLPSPLEQQAIASFLDNEITRLDSLLLVKEQLIDLLTEKRRALIAHAVTRGLDPNAPLRDSGIPWLGKIPAHWESSPLRFLTTSMGGATPDKANSDYWSGTIPWVSPKDMKRDQISDAEDHVTEDAVTDSALHMIPANSVLVVVRGMILAHSFPVAITTEPVTINQDMKAIQCGPLLNPHFLQAVFQGLASALVSLTDESAHGTKKLDTEVLAKFEIPLPPIQEQQSIVSFINIGLSKLNALHGRATQTIDLLKERRAALITAAVTGQLDIPEAA